MHAEIEKWTKQIAAGKAKRDKELGKLEMLMSRLKADYGLNSLEELKVEVKRLEAEYQIKEKELEEKINDFRDKYADKLAEAAR